MLFAVPRGIVYHRVADDFKWLFKAFFSRLDDPEPIARFEQQFAALVGRRYCLAFPFARTAIYFSLKSRNFAPGSEIIMPPITIKAILDVVLDIGLKPVFVDINPDTLCFDMDELRKAVGPNTKAIILTYLFGIVPEVDELVDFCKKHQMFVIEDFSQCLNGRYRGRKVGCSGDVGIYSASSIKTLDTYGGGLLVCDNEELYEYLNKEKNGLLPPARKFLISKIITDLVRNTATSRIVFHFLVFPLLKLMNYLKPKSVLKQTGDRDKEMIDALPESWFTSYTSLQAAAGLEFLPRLDSEDWQRLENVRMIKSSANIARFPRGADGGENIYWQLIAYFDDAARMQKHMHACSVDTASTSLVKISSLSSYPYQGCTPNADRLYRNGLFVPCFPGLDSDDIQKIVGALKGS